MRAVGVPDGACLTMFQPVVRWQPLLAVAGALALAGCATTAPAPPGQASTPPDVNRPHTPPDSTHGQFINATRWSVRVYVGVTPETLATATPVVLAPGESRPWQLDLGQHRVIARAHGVDAGEPLMGRFDRTIELDPRRGGWFLRFREADFR
jgi:hypothetical protein